MNSLGITLLTFDLGVPLGGEGFTKYSVKLKELKPGVIGLSLSSGPELTPLTVPFSIACVSGASFN